MLRRDLRAEGKVGRNENDHRYFIAGTATLYGPPLNSDGTPMIEQEDGTFLTSKKQVFMGANGKPVKRRRKRGE
jgi:hypothetical protein